MENKDRGYISLYRSIQEHYLYPNHRKFTEFEAWIDILLSANYKDVKILIDLKMQEIKRGSFLTSELKLSLRWLWNRDRVRNFLKLLEKDTMILKQSTKKFTIISICNYDQYQIIPTTKQQQPDNKATTKQQQPDTDNNSNKENKENNEKKKELIFPFTSKKFLDTWGILIAEKKWKGKSLAALQMSLDKLGKQTESDAILMMENSIAAGWQGLFELKGTKNKPPEIASSEKRTYDTTQTKFKT